MTERIKVGVDSWARCLRCGGYLAKRRTTETHIIGRCEGCGNIERRYKTRRRGQGEAA